MQRRREGEDRRLPRTMEDATTRPVSTASARLRFSKLLFLLVLTLTPTNAAGDAVNVTEAPGSALADGFTSSQLRRPTKPQLGQEEGWINKFRRDVVFPCDDTDARTRTTTRPLTDRRRTTATTAATAPVQPSRYSYYEQRALLSEEGQIRARRERYYATIARTVQVQRELQESSSEGDDAADAVSTVSVSLSCLFHVQWLLL